MQITYDTERSNRDDGIALIALLTSLYGLESGAPLRVPPARTTSPEQTASFPQAPAAPSRTGAADNGGVAAYAEAAGQALAPALPAPVDVAEVDSAGTPFDPEVHSSSKAKRADGTWRARRGAGKDDAPETAAPPPPAPSAPAAPPPPEAAAPPPPAPSAPTAPAAGGFDPGFRPLMMKVTAAQTAGKLTVAQVNQIVSTFGLSSLGQLAKAPGAEFLPMVEAEIDAAIAEAG